MRSMSDPDYVYTPRTAESIEKQRASILRRLGIPPGFRRLYGEHVAETDAGKLRPYAQEVARKNGYEAAQWFVRGFLYANGHRKKGDSEKAWATRRLNYGNGYKPTDTWRNCEHPKSPATARRGDMRYGCRLCVEEGNRKARFIDRVLQSATGELDPHYAIDNRRLGVRVMRILSAHDHLDRAAYILLVGHRFSADECAAHLGEAPDSLRSRAKNVAKAIAATEHQNAHKDWGLVQRLIDEGIPENEVKEMIQITPNGWFKAKQRGDVRV